MCDVAQVKLKKQVTDYDLWRDLRYLFIKKIVS